MSNVTSKYSRLPERSIETPPSLSAPLNSNLKEKRKYVARPGIEPRTSDLRVRCPSDCARAFRLISELLVLPGIRCLSVCHRHFQKSFPLKHTDRLKPNYMWRLPVSSKRKFALVVLMATMPIYDKTR